MMAASVYINSAISSQTKRKGRLRCCRAFLKKKAQTDLICAFTVFNRQFVTKDIIRLIMKLFYFDLYGRAEAIRMLLNYAK